MGILSKLFGDKPPTVQPTHVTDSNFNQEVLASEIPVVVDFWSDGCPPCRQLEPIIMGLATDYAGRVKVCEVPVREARAVAAQYRIQGTPTVLYFAPGGKLVERVVGFRGRAYHQEVIDVALLGGE